MSEPTEPHLSKAAVVAFVLGVASPIFSVVAALPAMYIGLQAVRAINSSGGQLRGHRLAIVGMILGAAMTLVTAIGCVALALLYLQDRSQVTVCTNNLRQIGQAVNTYSDHHIGHFPPATVPNAALTPDRRLSWEAAIVPFLSQGEAAGKKWEKLAGDIAFLEACDAPANAGPRQTNVTPYLCPTFVRAFSANGPGLTSYVGIAGVGLDAAGLPLTDPRAGFFGYERVLTRPDISAGISTTMIAVETTRDNGPWLAGGTPTVRGLDPNCEHYLGLGQPLGGLHRDGVNILWADGSVRFLNDRIEPDDFRALARINR
jgi:prepilin-type processing-associated H-X9-DG protein